MERVRLQTAGLLDRFNERLWQLTRYLLARFATFDHTDHSFYLTSNPFPGETIYPGPYRLGKNVEDANTYRVGHPLAQRLLGQAKELPLPPVELTFSYSDCGKNIAILEDWIGKGGWLTCSHLSVRSFETEESLIFAGITDHQEELDETVCRRAFDLSGEASQPIEIPLSIQSHLANITARRQTELLAVIGERNGHWFEAEMDKLDRWAEDRRSSPEGRFGSLGPGDQGDKKGGTPGRQHPQQAGVTTKSS